MKQSLGQYSELLFAIVNNIALLRRTASIILEAAVSIEDIAERNTMVAFANNLLFACTDEAGKFYIVKELYPNKLSNKELSNSGFYLHDKKLSKLITIVRDRQKLRGGTPIGTDKQTLKFLRGFKDSTLYIDYDDRVSQVIRPSDSLTLKKDIFKGYIDIICNLENMVRGDYEIFKHEKH